MDVVILVVISFTVFRDDVKFSVILFVRQYFILETLEIC